MLLWSRMQWSLSWQSSTSLKDSECGSTCFVLFVATIYSRMRSLISFKVSVRNILHKHEERRERARAPPRRLWH
jgi:hypothetical protein